MAGKHRVEAPTTSTVAKVAGLAGIAVTASLMGAGSAHADPFSDALNRLGFGASKAATGAAAATNNVTVPLYRGFNTGSFFTNPTSATPLPGGSLITVPGPTTPPASGITYVTTNGFRITGLCLNSRGCNP